MSQYNPTPSHNPYGNGGPPHGKPPVLATVALVLGIIAMILSPLLVFGIAAIIVGIVAVSSTGGHPGQPGRGRATAGIVMGACSFVMIFVLALLIGILLPALGAARRTARRMQNSTQLRDMHQGMITFANTNKEHYPGMDASGNILLESMTDTGNSGDGDTVEARYWILLDGSFITPEYAISPSESEAKRAWARSAPVTSSSYSYAMLSIEGQPGGPPTSSNRSDEWHQTLNTQAIVVSDRNIGTNNSTMIQSVHTSNPGEWKGSILWNDNHVGFEQSPIFATRYGHGNLNVDHSGSPNDHIFERAGNDDAFMIDEGD